MKQLQIDQNVKPELAVKELKIDQTNINEYREKHIHAEVVRIYIQSHKDLEIID